MNESSRNLWIDYRSSPLFAAGAFSFPLLYLQCRCGGSVEKNKLLTRQRYNQFYASGDTYRFKRIDFFFVNGWDILTGMMMRLGLLDVDYLGLTGVEKIKDVSTYSIFHTRFLSTDLF